jgi:hypothetical protein
VKLAEQEGVVGSDYINANFVKNTNEGRNYICTQAPTEATAKQSPRISGLSLNILRFLPGPSQSFVRQLSPPTLISSLVQPTSPPSR